jgi:hypothetical protein
MVQNMNLENAERYNENMRICGHLTRKPCTYELIPQHIDIFENCRLCEI